MVAIEKIHEMFPELEEIKDQELREKTAAVWKDAMDRGGWEDMAGVPFTLIIDDLDELIAEHEAVEGQVDISATIPVCAAARSQTLVFPAAGPRPRTHSEQ